MHLALSNCYGRPLEAESYAADGFGDAAWPNESDDAADVYEEECLHVCM